MIVMNEQVLRKNVGVAAAFHFIRCSLAATPHTQARTTVRPGRHRRNSNIAASQRVAHGTARLRTHKISKVPFCVTEQQRRASLITFPLTVLSSFLTQATTGHSTFKMYNALAVLYSIFFLFSSATSALFLPQFKLSKPSSPDLSRKCTFNLWHKQLLTTSTKTNYVQLNEIRDNTNDITIDIAALRPATERNSYVKISATQSLSVEGLPDNTTLTIEGGNDNDEMFFEHDGIYFSSDEMKNSNDAWCIDGAWDNDVKSGVGSRVSLRKLSWMEVVLTTVQERKLQCAFPCAAIDEDDADVRELR
jgi:hypothetical protein